MTTNIRPEVLQLSAKGRLPVESLAVSEAELEAWAALVRGLADGPPPTADELDLLFRVFPDDGDLSFGLAWSLLHVLEKSEDGAFATTFVRALPETFERSRQWMETFAIRSLNSEHFREILIAEGLRADSEARTRLVEMIRGITNGPRDAATERAELALAKLT